MAGGNTGKAGRTDLKPCANSCVKAHGKQGIDRKDRKENKAGCGEGELGRVFMTASQAAKTGSNPVGDANFLYGFLKMCQIVCQFENVFTLRPLIRSLV